MSDINVTVQDEIVNIDVLDTPVLVNVVNSPGQQGPAGPGVPVGGTAGQVLAKNSSTNYDTVWVNQSGGVPYSGATGNVNIGEYELKAGQVTLDTSPTGTVAVGTIRWNDTTGTSETTLKGGNVIIKNGVDLVARVVNKVSPNTTLTKAAYQAVKVSGAQGQRLAIELAQANNDAGSADTIGLVTETIAPNQEGFIMTVGQLEGINTTGSLQGETWVDGDVLYLSPTTAGAITNVKPTGATGHLVIIGYVEYAHANNGKLYIKVANGFELDELHNVSIVTPANNQGLFYNSSNSLWENKTISTALGYTPVPTTRNITINGVTYDLSADRTWTIAAGISGSGAAGQVTYWTGTSAVSGSNNLFWDNANGRLGIGTNAPAEELTVVGTIRSNAKTGADNVFLEGYNSAGTFIGQIKEASSGGFGGLQFNGQRNDATGGAGIFFNSFVGTTASGNNAAVQFNANGGIITSPSDLPTGIPIAIFSKRSGGVTVNQMALFQTGNLLLQNGGTFTDNGQRLQVYGDTLLRGSGNTSATTALTVQNSDSANLFRVLNNGQINLGNSASFPYIRTVVSDFTQTPTGTKVIFGTQDTTTGNGSFLFGSNTLSHTSGTVTYVQLLRGFVATSGTGSTTDLLLNGTINQTGGANGITRGLLIAPTLTSAADWRSIEWSNNSGWGLYGAGSANNYLAGNLGIGITPTVRLHVSGDTILRGSGATSATTALTVQNSSSQNILRHRNDGLLQFGNAALPVWIFPYSTTYDTIDINGQNLTFYPLNGSISFGSGTQAPTSGNANNVITKGRFQPTSGTATFADIRCEPLINQTGGANGITRGLYVNPTLTSAADFRAIETTNGRIVFGNLPTSSAGLPTGALWNDAGTVKIV